MVLSLFALLESNAGGCAVGHRLSGRHRSSEQVSLAETRRTNLEVQDVLLHTLARFAFAVHVTPGMLANFPCKGWRKTGSTTRKLVAYLHGGNESRVLIACVSALCSLQDFHQGALSCVCSHRFCLQCSR